MKKIILLMLIAVPALAENSLEQFRIIEQGGSGLSTPSSGLSCFHDADNSVSMCVYTSDTTGVDIQVTGPTTDAAPKNLAILPAPIYSGGVNPVNGTGGSVGIIPSPGEHSLEITNVANLATDTLTFTTCLNTMAACSTTVITEGAGGGQVNCVGAGLNLAQCALAYKTLLDAHATLGPATVVTCTDATCSDAKFGIYLTPGTSSYVHVAYASGGSVGLTLADGADGQFLVSNSLSSATPVITAINDNDTGIGIGRVANQIDITCGGAQCANFSGTNFLAVYGVVGGTSIHAGNGAAGVFRNYPQTITCADEGGPGVHSTCGGAATITSNVVQFVCNDADGCTFTIAETGFSATLAGNVTLHGPAANHVDVADSAGVLELAGGAAMAMDAADTLSISYSTLLYWAETGRSAN